MRLALTPGLFPPGRDHPELFARVGPGAGGGGGGCQKLLAQCDQQIQAVLQELAGRY